MQGQIDASATLSRQIDVSTNAYWILSLVQETLPQKLDLSFSLQESYLWNCSHVPFSALIYMLLVWIPTARFVQPTREVQGVDRYFEVL